MRVVPGRLYNVVVWYTTQRGDSFSHEVNSRRLVALAPVWMWREIRAIGLDQQAIERDALRDFVKLSCFGEGDRPGQRDVRAQLKAGGGVGPIATEGVHDNREALRGLRQNPHGIGLCIPSMDHHRQPVLACESELLPKQRVLCILRRAVMVIIQADLAQRDDFWLPEQRDDLAQMLGGRRDRVVRLNPGGREDLGLLGGKRGAGVARRQVVADVDQPGDTSRRSALQHLGAIGVEGLDMNMGMRIDQWHIPILP